MLKLSYYYRNLPTKHQFKTGIRALLKNNRAMFQQMRNWLGHRGRTSENLVEQLRQSELRYRTFAEMVADYTFSVVIAPDGQVTTEWVSETFSQVGGYTLDELLESDGILKMLHPDDLSIGREQLRKLLAGQSDVIIECRIITKTGEVRWFRHYGKPEWDSQQQRVVRIFMAGKDITDRKQAEAALQEKQHFIESITQATPNILFDRIKKCNIYSNREAAPVLGYTPQEIEQTGANLISPYYRDGELAGGIAVVTGITEQKSTEQYIRRQNQFMEVLHDTALGMLNHLDPTELLENIVVQAGRLVGTEHGFIYLLDQTSDELTMKRAFGTGRLNTPLNARRKFGEGLVGQVWQTEQPITLNNYSKWPGQLPQLIPDVYSQAIVGIPIKSNAEMFGVLGLVFMEVGRTFTEEEVAMLERFAQLASVALDNAQLYTATQRRLSELNTIQRIAQAINSNLQLDQFFELVVEQISQAFDYRMVSIYLCTEDGLALQAYVGYDKVIEFIRFDQGISGRVVLSGEAAFISDASQDADFLEATPGIQQNIIVPLKSKQNLVIGTMSVESQGEPILAEADFSLLKLLADQISIGVENASLFNDLAIARDQALEAARLKSQFLANMSHEIRTPISSVIGMTELLLDTSLEAQQQDFATTIRYSAELLLNLINDILDSSKIEANKLTLETLDFDLTKLVEETVGLVMPNVLEKGLTLTSFVEPPLKKRVIGDPTRLRQVLLNLLSNAIKFTNEGNIWLQIKIEEQTEQQATLQFEIRDNGIGMSSDIITRLFQPFTQADSSTSRRYGGTGLGLSITQQLVELMGGRLVVESEEGKGSIFSFSLVLDCVNSDATYTWPDFRSLSWQPPFLETECRLLLVEDNPVNQKLVRLQLQKLGYRVETVNNGHDAIQLISQAAYDLVLMDCQMPELDGFEATRAIRHNEASTEQHTIIVAMTASAMPGDKERCLEAGMDDYLSKPIMLEQLQAVLRRWLIPKGQKETDPVIALPGVSEAEAAGIVLNVATLVQPDETKEDELSVYAILDAEVIASLRQLQSFDSENVLTQVIDFFLEDSQKWLTDLHQAITTHNPKELAQAAHTLKGSSANLGAKAFAVLCSELENLGRTGNFGEANALLPKLEAAYLKLRLAFQAERTVLYQARLNNALSR